MAFCSKCGAQVNDAAFCPACGAKIGGNTPQTERSATPKKKRMERGKLLLSARLPDKVKIGRPIVAAVSIIILIWVILSINGNWRMKEDLGGFLTFMYIALIACVLEEVYFFFSGKSYCDLYEGEIEGMSRLKLTELSNMQRFVLRYDEITDVQAMGKFVTIRTERTSYEVACYNHAAEIARIIGERMPKED